MIDPDKHLDTFARAVATLGMDFVTAPILIAFSTARGWSFGDPDGLSVSDFAQAFISRYPAWEEMSHGKGIALNKGASAHTKMAWAAFVRECQVEAGVAP